MLVLACSARKLDPGFVQRDQARGINRRALAPLYQLYDGPAWRMIRARYAVGGMLESGRHVWALSALHGLVPCYHQAEIYDHRLETDSDAYALAASESDFSLRHFGRVALRSPEVLLFGSALYGRAFEAMMARLATLENVFVRWRKTEGGIGSQLGQLSAELRDWHPKTPDLLVNDTLDGVTLTPSRA